MIAGWWEKIRVIIMLSPHKLALLLFITVSSLSLLFQIVMFFLSPSEGASEGCKQAKETLSREITAAGYCDSDSDCISLKANCPFNCAAIHKNTLSPLIQKITDYSQKCGLCISECAPTGGTVSCVNHQCSF